MTKLSQQLQQKQVPQAPRSTRTQRVRQQQLASRSQSLRSKAEQYRTSKLQGKTFTKEEYAQEYQSIPSDIKPFFQSPQEFNQAHEQSQQEYMQTEEYQKQKFEAEAYNLAVMWINRKMQGKRIITVAYGDDDPALYRRAREHYSDFLEDPKLSRAVSEANVGYARAIESGFTNVEEYQSASAWGRKEAQISQKWHQQALAVQYQKERFEGKSFTPEEYHKEYILLPPNVRQHFQTPEQFTQQTRESSYQQWQEERATKPIYPDIETPEKEMGIKDVLKIPFGMTTDLAKKGLGVGMKGFEMLPSAWYIEQPRTSIGLLKITPFPANPLALIKPSSYLFKEPERTNVTEILTEAQGGIKRKKADLLEAEITEYGIREKVEPEFQEEYQTRFEDKYIKQIIDDEISFEEAQKKFAEGDVAKDIERRYGEAIQTGREEIEFTGKARYGLKQAGLTFGSLGITAVKSPKNLLVTIGVIKTAGLGLKAIGTKGSYLLTTGTFVYGGVQTFNPTSTSEEVGAGIITMGVSGAFLTYGAIKYARSPTVRTVKIKPEVTRVRASMRSPPHSPRVSVTDVEGKVTTASKYTIQKSYTQIVEGRRTVVSTKARDVVRKFWMNLGVSEKSATSGLGKPIYRGVPYKDRVVQADKTVMQRILGIGKTKTNYQSAYDKLVKYGWTQAQAKATLRYYQPRVLDIKEIGTAKIVSGERYPEPRFRFDVERTITQPRIAIDKELGIYTRKATPIKEYITAKGKVIGTTGDKILYQSHVEVVKTYLTRQGASYQKLTQAGKTTKQFEQLTGIESKGQQVLRVTQKEKVYDFLREARVRELPYEDIIQRSIAKQTIPRGATRLSKSDLMAFERDVPTVDIDMREVTGITVTRDTRIAKPISRGTPIEKYTRDDMRKLIKTLEGVYGKSNVKSVVDRTKDIAGMPKGIPTPTDQATALKQATDIKGIPYQEFKVDPILKGIIKTKTGVKPFVMTSQIGAMASLSATQLRQGLQPRTELRTMLQEDLMEDELLKVDEGLVEGQATAQSLRFSQVPDTRTPTIQTPVSIPDVQIPLQPPVPIIIPFLPKGIGVTGKARKQKTPEFKAYLPDFTARSLGLEPETLTQKQAKKKLKKLLTGLEIRRGVQII